MAFKISANTLLERHCLMVRSEGVLCVETAFTGGRNRYRFSDIECVLLSPDHKLSLQVGQKVFSIQTKPGNPKHQQVIALLVQEVRRAQGMPAEPA